MSEKIKEIFEIDELFNEWKTFLSWCYENNDKTVEIHRDKIEYVMNYITNLQKENEKLKELEYKFFFCSEDEESFTLDDYLKISNELYDCEEKLKDYKQRNEKAIEWCECVVNAKYTADKLPNGKTTDMGYCLDLAEPLLNILEGGDE